MKEKILGIITEWMMQQDDSVISDRIAHRLLAAEIEHLINKEVEIRIAERILTEGEEC